jgi:haloalkane dehalogenase/tRNA(adenine34) deaminase
MDALRTPDERFAALRGFPFSPHYVDALPALRMHYVDEGPRAAAHTFLCLHGQPTWAYLYRRMIPAFVAAGARVVAPDLYGFGRSDKPRDEAWYTFTRHRDSLAAFVGRLDLRGITLVCQDWGGILGLTLPMDMPERFARLVVMNTTLGTGDAPLGEGFLAWRAWSNKSPDMDVAKLMQRACPHLAPAEAARMSSSDGRIMARAPATLRPRSHPPRSAGRRSSPPRRARARREQDPRQRAPRSGYGPARLRPT